MNDSCSIAYFSMEVAVHPEVPTYSGGLGMLAGDTIRSAADAAIPMVAVSLLYRDGYFHQKLDESGWQSEEPVRWSVDDFLHEVLNVRVAVEIEGRTVYIRAFHFDVAGVDGSASAANGQRREHATVPVYFLDTDLPENSEWDRGITRSLYGGDSHYRLCQEIVLGIGGVRMLRALGYSQLERFHMNEGHAALLTIELLRKIREQAGRQENAPEDLDRVRRACVFTTHTPVPAGHDQFELDHVRRVLGSCPVCLTAEEACHEGRLNMTYLALSHSHYINGVAKRHGEVSRHMFGRYRIDAITNGVHATTWVCPEFATLFQERIPGWPQDNFSLRYALSLSNDEVLTAHRGAKHRLLEFANREANCGFDIDVLTLGFARRAAAYKRVDLIFDDIERLRHISRDIGRLQIIFAGKAHPRDESGKKLIQRVVETARSLAPDIAITFLPNYDMEMGRLLTAGVDVWLNTPEPPMEASGSSGMKAALNAVPSLSILDGWWIEGCIENVTGWAIGTDIAGAGLPDNRAADAAALYEKLEQTVVPMFYRDPARFADVMRHTVALNGSFFNTQRMVQQYALKAWFE